MLEQIRLDLSHQMGLAIEPENDRETKWTYHMAACLNSNVTLASMMHDSHLHSSWLLSCKLFFNVPLIASVWCSVGRSNIAVSLIMALLVMAPCPCYCHAHFLWISLAIQLVFSPSTSGFFAFTKFIKFIQHPSCLLCTMFKEFVIFDVLHFPKTTMF